VSVIAYICVCLPCVFECVLVRIYNCVCVCVFVGGRKATHVARFNRSDVVQKKKDFSKGGH
jgi:hypothetical protein